MRLHGDFSRRALVRPEEQRWVPSPTPGVTRMMFDRVGDEVARATSLVRYAPNSTFPEHTHGGGEEIFVLEGEFADDHGAYPAGTYLRNPMGTRHAPKVGPGGAMIFVKLHQFHPDDRRQFALDTRSAGWPEAHEGEVALLPLHGHGGESVHLVRWPPGHRWAPGATGDGAELFVLEGRLEGDFGALDTGGWLRLPPGDLAELQGGAGGALTYLKTGHLPPAPPAG